MNEEINHISNENGKTRTDFHQDYTMFIKNKGNSFSILVNLF